MRVVVIGAGVIGSAVADALAVRGADVVVLEMRSPGAGASQASAGILAPFTEAQQGAPLLTLGARSLAMFDAFVAGVVDRSRRPVEYGRTGTVEIAFDAETADALRATQAWVSAAGVRCDWLNARELREFEAGVSASAAGGLFVETHGFVSVSQLVAALMHSARFSGAALAAPVEVVSIVPREREVDVKAGSREWTADAVVIATGSWTNRIRVAGAALPALRPIRGQLLQLRLDPGSRPARIVWGPDCYTVPWSDGSLLVGATAEDVGFDERSTVEGVRALSQAVIRLLPACASAPIEAVRVGLRPASADGLPFIGALSGLPNVVIAAGHYRNGILLAPLSARIVADYVLDGTIDDTMAITAPDRAAG